MMPSDLKSLETIEVFSNLLPDVRGRLEKRCRWRQINPHEMIIDHQDNSRDVFFLTRGRAKVVLYSIAGKAVSFRDIGPGDMFGEFAAIDGCERSASIEALEECTIAVMSPMTFNDILRTEPDAAIALMQRLITEIRNLTARIYEFSTLGVQNRIHAELLRHVSEADVRNGSAVIRPTPTHAEIASHISTHREAVSREISRLTKMGIIERSGHDIRVVDVERLADMVHQAMGE